MKNPLLIVLTLIICLIAIVSCGSEQDSSINSSESSSQSSSQSDSYTESQSESVSEESKTEAQTESSLGDNVVNNITRDHFASAYKSWNIECVRLLDDEDTYPSAQIFFNYEDFSKTVITFFPEEITKETFDNNFVILIHSLDESNADIYYTDFKNDKYHDYTITRNVVFAERETILQNDKSVCDICIIPKELCNTEYPCLKIIVKKYKYLSDEKYKGACEVSEKKYTVEQDLSYTIERRQEDEAPRQISIKDIEAIDDILNSKQTIVENGILYDTASPYLMRFHGRKILCSDDFKLLSDTLNHMSIFLTEEQADELRTIVEGHLGRILNNVNRDTFATAYQSWTGDYYNLEIPEGATRPFYYLKAFFSYEDFAKGIIDSTPKEITEQTFEDNFVLVISGLSPHIRTEDIHYTDFSKQDGYYTITYNKVSSEYMDFMETVDPFCDICIIPKELCDTPKANFKVIEKEYIYFSDENGTLYTGSCKMYQETFDVIGDYRIENRSTKEQVNLTSEEIATINNILFSENSVWEDGCCDCISPIIIHWNGRKLEVSNHAINDAENWIKFSLTEEQSEKISKIAEKYFGDYDK